MAKAAINKTLKLNATGYIGIENGIVVIENSDTGELIPFDVLLSDFIDKPVKLSIAYDYGYDDQEDA